jgi:hypothetical protein
MMLTQRRYVYKAAAMHLPKLQIQFLAPAVTVRISLQPAMVCFFQATDLPDRIASVWSMGTSNPQERLAQGNRRFCRTSNGPNLVRTRFI